jgi:tetratricopeptide (TPR) repeat protein
MIFFKGVPSNEFQRESDERAPVIERLDDPRALVGLRRLELEISLATLVGVGEAAERLLAAARDADDRPNAFEALFFLTASLVFGPVSVAEALTDMRRFHLLAQGPIEEAAVEHIEGLLRGMAGQPDEGLSVIRRARATFVEFGMRLHAVGTARDEGLIARYAGDPAAVERVLRPACDELRELGDTAILSLEVAELAEAYYELGGFDDADEAVGESERLAQHADVSPQVTWRRVRAKLLARRNENDEALRLVNEAIDRAQHASALELLGDGYRDLAEVERIVGRTDRAREAFAQALTAYDQKGPHSHGRARAVRTQGAARKHLTMLKGSSAPPSDPAEILRGFRFPRLRS